MAQSYFNTAQYDPVGSFQRGREGSQRNIAFQQAQEDRQRGLEREGQSRELLSQYSQDPSQENLMQLAGQNPEIAMKMQSMKVAQKASQRAQQKAEMDNKLRITEGYGATIKSMTPSQLSSGGYDNWRTNAEKDGLDMSKYPIVYEGNEQLINRMVDQEVSLVKNIRKSQLEAESIPNLRAIETEDGYYAFNPRTGGARPVRGAGGEILTKEKPVAEKIERRLQSAFGKSEVPDLGGVHVEELVGNDKLARQQQAIYDRKVKEDVRKNNLDVSKNIMNLKRFERAMGAFDTGAFTANKAKALAPLEALGIADASDYRTNYQAMQSLSNELALGQRKPGTGVMTDKDFEVFQGIVFGPDKTPEFNKEFIKASRSKLENDRDYEQFMTRYERQYQNLQGADAVWGQYMRDNPIFSDSQVNPETGEIDSIKFNEDREDWKGYFGIKKKKVVSSKQKQELSSIDAELEAINKELGL